MKDYLRSIFTLDLRALALVRILLGFGLVCDMIQRFLTREAFYSDLGTLPRWVQLEQFELNGSMSLLMLNGSSHFSGFLALLGVFTGLMLILGHGTRFFTLLGWIILTSFHARHSLVLHGGDNLLRLLFFYGLFLPLGARWSIDKLKLGPSYYPQQTILSAFTVAIIVQILCIYGFTTYYKLDPIWISEFSSLHFALSLDMFSTALGKWLLNFPNFLTVSSFFAIIVEGFAPLLLFVPFYNVYFRRSAILLFYALHLGIQATMVLGLFPLACLIIWTSLWDSKTMDLLERHIGHFFARVQGLTTKIHSFPYMLRPYLFKNRPSTLLGSLICLLVFSWNLEGTRAFPWFDIKSPVNEVVFFLQLNQQWNMFAPQPLRDDGYIVVDGELENNRSVNPLTMGPVTFSPPANFAATYPNSIWRKYLLSLYMRNGAPYRLHFGRFLCRRWNSQFHGEEALKRFKVFYMKIRTPERGQPRPTEPEPVQIWRHFCYGEIDDSY